jgi:hypothetical protein
MRFLLATDPNVLTQVLGIVYRTLSGRILKKGAAHARDGRHRLRDADPAFRLGAQAQRSLPQLFLDGAYLTETHPPVFRRIAVLSAQELQTLVKRIAERIGRALERNGLLVRDCENSFLTFDPTMGGVMDDLLGHSITYRVALGPRAGAEGLHAANRTAATAGGAERRSG